MKSGKGGGLPIDVEVMEEGAKISGLSGLLVYADLACVLGVLSSVDDHVGKGGNQGWMDRHHVLALIMLNLSGGDCVDDIESLEADAGAREVFRACEMWGLSRQESRELSRRFRKGRVRSFPSATRIHEFLETFHDEEQEALRERGRAFIPVPNDRLAGLIRVNRDLVLQAGSRYRGKTATLDIDATLQQTTKQQAMFCYEGYRAYQPLTAYWHETGLVVHSQFRDVNVPAGYGILAFLKETVSALPENVSEVRVRMDCAGYDHSALRWMATGGDGERDPILFTVGCPVYEAFRDAAAAVPESEWEAIPTPKGEPAQEWAEVLFVPNAIATEEFEPYRYIAVRERMLHGVLPGMEEMCSVSDLPFTPVVISPRSYRLRGIVTNMEGDGLEIIKHPRGRCGKGEEIHAVMKHDFAGGILPSKRFGANAAWWAIVVLAYNLHAALSLLTFHKKLLSRRMKAIRLALISVPALIVNHARRTIFRVPSVFDGLLAGIRTDLMLATLAPQPG